MRSCPTQYARIELGLATGRREGVLGEIDAAVVQLSLCISVMSTRYVYAGGGEDGLVIGLLDVPGRQSVKRETALGLARRLLGPAGQRSVSVVFPNETVLVTEGDDWPS